MILTLSVHIKRPLEDYTLLQATDILKALITVSLGIGLQLGLSIITFMGWQLIPNTIVVSASQSAWQAHSIEHANSLVYRRSIENDGGEEWKAVSNGLPQSEGTLIAILAANPRNKGEFYAINNRGLFCSTDTGLSWRELDVSWSKEYLSQHPWALAVKGQD